LYFLLAAWSGAAWAAPSIDGRWQTADGGGVIEIGPCGEAVCGRIIGTKGFKPDGSPPLDFRGVSQCKLQIIAGVKVEGPPPWKGTITDPRSGKMYKAELSTDDEGRLHLRGYVAVPLLGATQVWMPYRGTVTDDCHMG